MKVYLGSYDVVLYVIDPLVELGDVHLPIFSSSIGDLQPVQ